MKEIITVTGRIAPEELGFCQCHEHIAMSKGISYQINPALCMDDMEKSLEETKRFHLAGGAEQYGVTIAIEPVVKHIVYDARRARTVLDEIGSPNLQILFDPVNLLNMENVDRREEVFAEAIELLGKDIAMIHFKDFLRKDAGGQLAATGAGQGGMEDYRTILRFAKQEKPYIFATLENTTPENAVECLNYLKKQYDEC